MAQRSLATSMEPFQGLPSVASASAPASSVALVQRRGAPPTRPAPPRWRAGGRRRPKRGQLISEQLTVEDSRGYGGFEDLLSTHWEHPVDLVQDWPPSSPGRTQRSKTVVRIAGDGSTPFDSSLLSFEQAALSADPDEWEFPEPSNISFLEEDGMGATSSKMVGIASKAMTGTAGQASRSLAELLGSGPPRETPESGVSKELREMLNDIGVQFESIAMSEGMQAMLALAREAPNARHLDLHAQRAREEEEDLGEEGAATARGRSSARHGGLAGEGKRPASPLKPGIYAGAGDRDRLAPPTRGLPNRGRDMSFTQAQPPRVLISRGAAASRGLSSARGGRPVDWSGCFGQGGEEEEEAEAPPPTVKKKLLVQLRARPGTWEGHAIEKGEHDEVLRAERAEYAAWKRKVIESARLLDLEANRFRN